MSGQEIRLRRLTDPEYTKAESLARMSGVPLDQCPTCGGKEQEIPGSAGVMEFRSGTYRYRGEEHFCDCQAQMALRARYLLANIGDQYMRLDWADYDGPDRVRRDVANYLDQWQDFKINGMGLEFGGKGLGIGKTFGATYVGKELVKRGQKVYFIPFVDVISAYQRDDHQALEDTLRGVTYLILDELLPPYSEAQHALYAFKLEALIRHRTNFNLPTIITTNLSRDELDDYYPRTYSLLEAKQMRIDMSGVDARRNRIAEENLELAANGEVRPIT